MKVIMVLITLIFIVGCNGKSAEVEKLKAENEQLKGQVQAADKVQAETDMRNKYIVAMQDIKNLGGALESYITDNSKPPEHNSFKEMALDTNIVPYYIKKMPVLDPWGNEYYYKRTDGGEYGTYWIGCAGSDGVFSGFDQMGNPDLQAGIDIVYSNGEFKLAPK